VNPGRSSLDRLEQQGLQNASYWCKVRDDLRAKGYNEMQINQQVNYMKGKTAAPGTHGSYGGNSNNSSLAQLLQLFQNFGSNNTSNTGTSSQNSLLNLLLNCLGRA
jgi:hypothetical protein